MFEIVKSGGLLMIPILGCSVVAAAIIIERLWTLQQKRVLPDNLSRTVWKWVEKKQLNDKNIKALDESSPLGAILAAGLKNRNRDRVVMKERIEDTGRHVIHDLERFLNSLGTIAAITPLLGLLGTVIGMIKVFAAITTHGVGDPSVLAQGISVALITTGAGLSVAIPALIGYRYLSSRVDSLVIQIEKEAMRLVDTLEGNNK